VLIKLYPYLWLRIYIYNAKPDTSIKKFRK
jgi:hypothetical protein